MWAPPTNRRNARSHIFDRSTKARPENGKKIAAPLPPSLSKRMTRARLPGHGCPTGRFSRPSGWHRAGRLYLHFGCVVFSSERLSPTLPRAFCPTRSSAGVISRWQSSLHPPIRTPRSDCPEYTVNFVHTGMVEVKIRESATSFRARQSWIAAISDCQRREIFLAKPPTSRRRLDPGHSGVKTSRMAALEASCLRDFEFAFDPKEVP